MLRGKATSSRNVRDILCQPKRRKIFFFNLTFSYRSISFSFPSSLPLSLSFLFIYVRTCAVIQRDNLILQFLPFVVPSSWRITVTSESTTRIERTWTLSNFDLSALLHQKGWLSESYLWNLIIKRLRNKLTQETLFGNNTPSSLLNGVVHRCQSSNYGIARNRNSVLSFTLGWDP